MKGSLKSLVREMRDSCSRISWMCCGQWPLLHRMVYDVTKCSLSEKLHSERRSTTFVASVTGGRTFGAQTTTDCDVRSYKLHSPCFLFKYKIPFEVKLSVIYIFVFLPFGFPVLCPCFQFVLKSLTTNSKAFCLHTCRDGAMIIGSLSIR